VDLGTTNGSRVLSRDLGSIHQWPIKLCRASRQVCSVDSVDERNTPSSQGRARSVAVETKTTGPWDRQPDGGLTAGGRTRLGEQIACPTAMPNRPGRHTATGEETRQRHTGHLATCNVEPSLFRNFS